MGVAAPQQQFAKLKYDFPEVVPIQRKNNYAIMAEDARKRFLTYDQSAIIAKSPVTYDADFICLSVLDRACRVSRKTGHIALLADGIWQPSNDFNTVLTLFDYLCDSKADRTASGVLQTMSAFGRMFHTGLLEERDASSLEKAIDADPDAFIRACTALNGTPFARGDVAFTIPLFPDLAITLQFWHSDEEFPPQLRYFWDSSANDYIRYETMYYAVGLLESRLLALMQTS